MIKMIVAIAALYAIVYFFVAIATSRNGFYTRRVYLSGAEQHVVTIVIIVGLFIWAALSG